MQSNQGYKNTGNCYTSKLNYPQLSVHSCNYHTGASHHHLFDPCETVRGFESVHTPTVGATVHMRWGLNWAEEGVILGKPLKMFTSTEL